MTGYDENRIPQILKNSKTVAVVGISDKPDRDSYRVAKYLKSVGYEILPVNPALENWDGQPVYKNLGSIPGGKHVDIVDVFRKPEAALEVVQDAVKIKPGTIWLQEGVVNKEAADLAKKSGSFVVMDRCMMKEHRKSLD
ncbi:MAG: CoA-binding protein [Candidatus Thermoplasmatota archaeon]|nr:CoA-binding protein [Candidatus Thermoplasmatota archaeon]